MKLKEFTDNPLKLCVSAFKKVCRQCAGAMLAALMLSHTAVCMSQTADAARTGGETADGGRPMVDRLDSMMRDELLDTTQAAFMAWDLTAHKSLFCYNHRQIMRPASTMKILTAITALDRIAESHPFTTSLYCTGTVADGTLDGDLWCVGGMDPMFGHTDMDSLVAAVKQAGVSRIKGRVVADVSMKDTLRWGEGWCWDDDNVCLTPLTVDRKDMFVRMFIDKLARAGVDIAGAAAAEGREYISAEEKIRREEGEEAYQEELKKQADAAAKEEARIAKLTPDQRKSEDEANAKLLEEFNALRKAADKPAVNA